MPDQSLAIQMSGVAKRFGAVAANQDASLAVRRGEIHALVGENGAGKSTLMRVLAGLLVPDDGRVEVEGRDVTGWGAAAAIAAGIGMVHQHFMLVSALTVAENVVLGMEPRRGLALDRVAAERAVAALGARTGLVVPVDRPVSELSVGEAQRVEILKALYRGGRILVLDEPTAVLSPPEVEELWRVLRAMRADGGTVVLITHKLDEVMAISDAITVMRAGRTVARMRTVDTTPAAVARAMVGPDIAPTLGTRDAPTGVGCGTERRGEPDEARKTPDGAQGAPPNTTITLPPAGATTIAPPLAPTHRVPALRVRDLVVLHASGHRDVDGLSLEVAPGEILGIAGVDGNGQTELVEAIAGFRAFAGGRIELLGRDIGALGVRARAEAGLSHIPEDRQRRGLVLDFPVADNLILGRQHHFTGAVGRLDRRRIAAHAVEQIAAFDIRPADPTLPARALSGGNQQKVVVAREMGRDHAVLLAAQPTRGMDVGAIAFIHAQLRAARDAGRAVLLVSADLAELLALADRIAVMYRGRIAVVLPRAGLSPDVLGPYMTGVRAEAVS
jgi:simple sugar transport system ATP-binding protein